MKMRFGRDGVSGILQLLVVVGELQSTPVLPARHNPATFTAPTFHEDAPRTTNGRRSMSVVMEPIQTDYRLERWLAVLLSLLFFLPFVA
jgi:hypothetical protein